jgi:Mn2+/Fe2+ NRAMP family transporter
MENQEKLHPPPPDILSSNPLRWIRFIGPGAIMASVTVGTGETIFASREGSIFGYQILWVILLVSILKWVLCYSSMRHMIISGAHPFDRWSRIPGPRGWLPLYVILIGVVCFPLWYAYLEGVLGTVCKWLFGVKEAFEGKDKEVWATLFVGVSIVILYFGNYNFLEKGQITLLSIMLICIVLSVFYMDVDYGAVLNGTFLPHALEYPDWVFEVKPDMKDRSPWVEIVVYTAVIGGPAFDYFAYMSFLRDKKWGQCHLDIATDQELEEMARQNNHINRTWLRAAMIDATASFFMVAFLSGCFSILGTVVLGPEHLIPQDEDLLNYQSLYFTQLAPWLVWVYKIAIFSAFVSILYGGPEICVRIYHEYLNSLPRLKGHVPGRILRFAVIFWCLIGGLIVLWIKSFIPETSTLIEFISPASIYAGGICCGFYCLANPWMDWRFLPRALRMNGVLVVLNIFAGVVFLSTGLKALWDNWKYFDGQYAILSYIIILIQIGICMLLAYLFRGYLGEKTEKP